MRIEEVEGGSVPRLRLLNREKQEVLVLDGDLLLGGWQDRVANASVLVPPWGEAILPVSCVQRGRWGGASTAFKASPARTPISLQRRKATSSATAALSGADLAAPEQREVWNSVAACHADLGVRSGTGALADAYAAHGEEVDRFVGALADPAAIARLPPADGLVAALGGSVASLELLESPGLLRRALPRLVRGHALEAIAWRRAGRRPLPDAFFRARRGARRLLDSLADLRPPEIRVTPAPAPADGLDVRLVSRRFVGSGLVVGERVVALVAFRGERPRP